MYVIIKTEHRQELAEMSASTYCANKDKRILVPVTARIAHKWVRDGGLHSTPLYVDGNRVRYAKG